MSQMNEKTEAETAVPKPRGGKATLLAIACVSALLAENAGLLLFYRPWTHGIPPLPGTVAAAVELEGKAEGEGGAAKTAMSVLKLSPFVVNLADSGQHSYARATFELGFPELEAATKVDVNPALLSPTRQAVIEILATRQSSEIVTAEGKERLRSEILSRLAVILKPSAPTDVYITDFLVQY